ncbi:MAG: recombinase family protein [Candidatus Omnitrophica bacterium]|nr:recombinase family protein [Candidatus Omnitrophota bacterium]MDD5236801.1 recombinase family protein [Candidatus Omnitrophota bacterium]MDD5610953.1 recombinase family protein [Candidatus Omnitrophota bacterium]
MKTIELKEKRIVNCAIYTRKSVSDGLERDFTTLDAQRESCESYIASQKNEGWVCLPEEYDDGGFTGANTDRPALQRLMTDIKANKVTCVVVYKVDRLSRSLLDFAELLSVFEDHGVTFVSVTQHFNTQNSMGRLTLNILLSFAQFEREIISERTRDKMGAAKRKGKWIGGRPPLGYNIDKDKHKLVINPKEAELVRKIFDLYIEKRSLLSVTMIMNDLRYTTKQYTSETGKKFGGIQFTSNGIQLILRNPLYIGKVSYQGELYPGEHEAIISGETFQKAQSILVENRPEWKTIKKAKHIGLLSGLLRCKACNCAMYFSYNIKASKYRYHYYLCMSARKRGYKTCPTRLLSAQKIEHKIVELLRTLTSLPKLDEKVWDTFSLQDKIAIIKTVLKEVSFDGNKGILEIVLLKDNKRRQYKVELKELKNLPVPPNQINIKNEPQLRQNLILAHQIQDIIAKGKAQDLKQVASWLNLSHVRICQITGMLLLAPEIQEEILFFSDKRLFEIPEYKVNEISKEFSWIKQKEIWKQLTVNSNAD